MLFNVLNDEFVADHIGLAPAHLPQSLSLQYVNLPLLCFQSMQFLKTNILQSSAVTLLGVVKSV